MDQAHELDREIRIGFGERRRELLEPPFSRIEGLPTPSVSSKRVTEDPTCEPPDGQRSLKQRVRLVRKGGFEPTGYPTES